MRSLYYPALIGILAPINWVLSYVLAWRVRPGSVLHVSYMGHIPFQTVQVLRAAGIDADYLAIGESTVWSRADFQLPSKGSAWLRPFLEFALVWRVVAHYAIVHLHFMVTPTRSGWELPVLKRMGRKVVIHLRGCEIRDRERNMAMFPEVNICQECDYRPYVCKAPHNVLRRELAARHGDAFLVTTPDLKDFAPSAIHMPFFVPERVAERAAGKTTAELVIVHATNHPGIEGTAQIKKAIANLAARGHRVRLVFLQGATQEQILDALASADLAIGKMKMGYYANTQIESMAAGVPTITFVRPEYMNAKLADSGFIFSTLNALEATIEHYLTHPEELEHKRRLARSSILVLHDNTAIALRYKALYDELTGDRAAR